MPDDDTEGAEGPHVRSNASNIKNPLANTTLSARRPPTSRLTIPPQLKALFDRFPFRVYPANNLPLRSPSSFQSVCGERKEKHTLYVFTTPSDTISGAPSYNPSCLKWQTLLKFHDIPFTTTPSNNHAAPGGISPFLLPAATANDPSPQAIPASKLESWILAHSQRPRQSGSKREVERRPRNPLANTYTSLLTPLRHAYTHALYLHPPTFTSLAKPLYINPASASPLIRLALETPLRAAALEQLVLGQPCLGGSGIGVRVDVEALYARAEEAVEALNEILGDAQWFSEAVDGEDGPGVLDAAVFAFVDVVLGYFGGQEEGSGARRLVGILEGRGGLVGHRERVLREYYGR